MKSASLLAQGLAVVMTLTIVQASACKGGAGSKAGEGGAHGGSATTEGGTTKRPDELIGDVPKTDGIAWKRVELPFGTAEVPDGSGWSLQPNGSVQVAHTDGTVIMFQTQPDVKPSQLADYLQAYDATQKQDAPKYAEVSRKMGTVKGTTAARIEGTYEHEQKFQTHDYILITQTGTVAAISGRAPDGPAAARLAAVVDHIVATAQIK